MPNTLLYPPITPYAEHSLQVDAQHILHIEESGNPLGLPVLFLHGGPGSGCQPIHRQFFDPNAYRIILFDQRGCGKSRPHACLTNNTSAHLIEDIEKIRQLLGVDQWVVFGGSWGSTLALLYAQSYPQRVLALILRGIFLCRQQDIHWFYQHGAHQVFPDYWQNFIAPIEPSAHSDLVSAYYQKLTGDNEIERMRCAEAWSEWEAKTATLTLNPDFVHDFSQPHHALALARIECHYFIHQAFIEPNQILNHCERLSHIPTHIIQGRYDMVCPMYQAYELAQALPHANLVICDQAGHSAMEPQIVQALLEATQHYQTLL